MVKNSLTFGILPAGVTAADDQLPRAFPNLTASGLADPSNTVTDMVAISAAATTLTRSEDTIGYGRSVGGAGTRDSADA